MFYRIILYIAIFLLIFNQLSMIKAENNRNFIFKNQTKDFRKDIGLDWHSLSLFKKNIIEDMKFKKNIKNNTISNIIIDQSKTSFQINWFLKFKNSFSIYVSPYLAKNHSSDNKNEIVVKPFIKNSIEFSNDWIEASFGRGNENWGSGNELELSLSDNSELYDYFSLASDYGNIRVKYIHGLLEKKNMIDRYIVGKGLEWTNKKSLVLGFSELIIYNGAFQIAYLNPISSHLEIENNKRFNQIQSSGSNAVWQLYLDSFLKNKFRLSLNLLIDEYVLDKIQKVNGKSHGLGFSGRVSYKLLHKNEEILNFYTSIFYIGTHTFRNANGTNNFVNNNQPLGWKYGSDGRQLKVGFNYSHSMKKILCLSYSILNLGEKSILYNPYTPYVNYQKGSFPSGDVLNERSIEVNYTYLINKKNTIHIKVK